MLYAPLLVFVLYSSLVSFDISEPIPVLFSFFFSLALVSCPFSINSIEKKREMEDCSGCVSSDPYRRSYDCMLHYTTKGDAGSSFILHYEKWRRRTICSVASSSSSSIVVDVIIRLAYKWGANWIRVSFKANLIFISFLLLLSISFFSCIEFFKRKEWKLNGKNIFLKGGTNSSSAQVLAGILYTRASTYYSPACYRL